MLVSRVAHASQEGGSGGWPKPASKVVYADYWGLC